MDINETLELNAYVDGELGLERQLEIEARLRGDAALRARVDALRRVREEVRGQAQYHAAPPGLLQGLRAASPNPAVAAPRGERAAQRGESAPGWRAWLAWRPLVPAFAAASLLAVGLNVALLQHSQQERVGEELVASHVRATLGQRLVDVASSDHHTVKPWLSARLDFSPPVHESELPNTEFLGGRVDYVDGREVAVLVSRHGNHVVDHYVWPTHAADSGVAFEVVKGFRVARWSADGMAHRVVSDLNAAELDAFVQALRRADAAR